MGVEAIDKDHRRRQEESDHQPMQRGGDELEPQRAFFASIGVQKAYVFPSLAQWASLMLPRLWRPIHDVDQAMGPKIKPPTFLVRKAVTIGR
ncbi:hypothetical protein [Mesorhizobium xinjiangense]|uniref:hypothetical protein n=1 Tax=Mesorhizobium xinjiangense TaxID=2678685 RepID=UPI0012EEB47C|nr:hypothetical protein [Mesorhizobium xinjiangense]